MKALVAIGAVSTGVLFTAPAVAAEQGAPAPQYVVDGGETPTRWDPCRPIVWKLAGRVGPQARREAVAAMRQVRRATGLSIRYAGMASADELRTVPDGMIVVQFLSKRGPRPGVIGTATNGVVGPYPDGSNRIFWSHVRIGRAGRDGARGYMNVLLHELGHAVGLDHVDYEHSVMWPWHGQMLRFAKGDLAGLHHVGAWRGCLSEPTPPVVPTTTVPPTVPPTTIVETDAPAS